MVVPAETVQQAVPALSTGKRKSLIFRLINHWPLLLMMAPAFIILLINSYLPMGGIILAFKKFNYADGIFGSPWYGFENFRYLFETDDAFLMTRNTILYNLVFIALHVIIAVTFAILLNELRQRVLAKFYQTVMFLPYFLSWIIVSYIGFAFLNTEFGFINTSVLKWFGADPVQWYSEKQYWPFILPFFSVWKDIGYATVVYLAAIIGFDSEYYEAALIDGASKRQQIWHITLPLLKPIITILLLLSIGKIFYADFGLFYQVTLNSGMLYDATIVIDTYVYTTMMSLGDMGMAAAAGFYQSFVGFVLILTSNWAVRKFNKDYSLF